MSSFFNPLPSPPAGPPSEISTISFSSSGRIFFTTATSSATAAPSLYATSGTSASTTTTSSDFSVPTVNSQSDSSSTQSGSGVRLSTGEIIAIAMGSFILILAAVAVVAFNVVRHRQDRKNGRFGYDQGSESGRTSHSNEKFSGDVKDASYTESRRSLIETRGIAPLLNAQPYSPLESDRRNSRTGDSSPFINPVYESGEVRQAHTATLADATPSPQSIAGAQLETVFLYPSPSAAPSRYDVKLHPLVIPEYNTSTPAAVTLPGRRASRTRHSRGSSKHASRPLDGSYDSDDSASLYSQFSASTHQSVRTTQGIAASIMQVFPFTTVPLASSPNEVSNDDILKGSPRSLFDPIPLPPADRSETHEGVERADTVVIAGLLKSRLKHTSHQPSRSSSIISHIERNGSIRPAFSPIEEEGERETPRERYLRMKKEQPHAEQYVIPPPMQTAASPPARAERPLSTPVQPLEVAQAELPPTIPVSPTQTPPLRPKRSSARP